jgi:glycosyltransferase involved in cell wall biosynthesis
MILAAPRVDPEETPSVLLVAESGGPGGISRYCVDVAEALGPAAGIACLCADSATGCGACWLKPQCAARHVPLVAIPMGPKQWKQGHKGLAALWNHTQRPLVHTNGRRANFIAQLLATTTREFSFVTTAHGVLSFHAKRNALYRLVDLAAYRRSAAVIAVSADTRRRLVGMGSPAATTIHIPNGLRAEDIARLSGWAACRAGPGGAGRPARVGYLGRLSPEKGIEEFVLLATRLHRADRSVGFVIAGDGPRKQSTMAETKDLASAGAFSYLGETQEVDGMLGRVDILVMPSRSEGMPYVLLEGMAAGCAVAAFGVGGIPEIVSDRSIGSIVRPGDTEGLYREVLRLVEDAESTRAIGERACLHVRSLFRLEDRIPRLLEAYDTAKPNRRGPLDLALPDGPFKRCV